MRKLFLAAVALAALAGSANPAEKYLPMTIDFVGDCPRQAILLHALCDGCENAHGAIDAKLVDAPPPPPC